jgi:prepilin-type N-terminal cleavage/methylation domain-containing protein
MDFNLTSTKSALRRRQAAMTLVEIMVAMGIGGIILLIIGSLSLWSSRSFAAMANYAELDAASRNALDSMTREIRQVQGLNTYTTNGVIKELALIDSDGQPLYYRYDQDAQTLTRTKSGNSKVILRDCTLLNFNLYQRNNVSNTFNQYTVATGTNASLTCKVIQINWICSRKLLPTELINSESVQTAKIVIRHH